MGIKKVVDIKKEEFEDFVLPQYIESWIQGYPLNSNYGFIKAIKIKDYFKYIGEIDFIKKQDWEVKNQVLIELRKADEDTFKLVKEDFDKNNFMTCIRNNVAGLRDQYNRVFSVFIHNFNSDRFYWTLTKSELDDLRKLILDFNHIQYYEKNPNPEIEKFNRLSRNHASVKSGTIDFDTVFSTLMTKEGGGYLPSQINNLTIRQFYLAFKRVEYNKANEMTILFKTVDAKGDIEIVDWNRSFREAEEDNTFENLDDMHSNMNKKIK